MDIVIRNGVIDKSEAKRVREIKNENGFLKKDYKDFILGVPGPYYDLMNSHLCVPRRAHIIKNFYGPQDPRKIKLLENTDKISEKCMYCVICHKLIIQTTTSHSKKRILIEENIFAKKPNASDTLHESVKKIKIEDNSEENIEKDLEQKLEQIKISVPGKKWKDLYDKMYNYNITDSIRMEKIKQKRIIDRFSKLCYKLITEPIRYEISHFETKLIYPNELTPYQKFKLNNPDYKKSPLFSHRRNSRITANYVTIE